MGITTKMGDKGETSLYGGGIVSKDHIIIETCGSLDELSSFLGLAKGLLKDKQAKSIIVSIQHDLFIVGAEVSCKAGLASKLKKRIGPGHVADLDKVISGFEKKNKLRNSFCLPGENSVSAILDVSRAITRRAERMVVTMKKKELLNNWHILIYLNRLSDLLYLLARACEKNK